MDVVGGALGIRPVAPLAKHLAVSSDVPESAIILGALGRVPVGEKHVRGKARIVLAGGKAIVEVAGEDVTSDTTQYTIVVSCAPNESVVVKYDDDTTETITCIRFYRNGYNMI